MFVVKVYCKIDLTVNFHHEHFIDPTDCPWVSEDGVEGVRKGRGIPFKRLPRRLELAFQADLLRAPAPRIPVGGSARISDSHRYFTSSLVPNSQKNEGTLVGHNPSRSFLKLLWPGGEGDTVWSQKNFSASRNLEPINPLSK